MGLPWYKRNPEKALNGMLALTLEEKGAYTTVLDLIYLKNGKLRDDDAFIVGWLGRTNVRAWRRLKQSLIAKGKLVLVAGFIRNRAADIVLGVGKFDESLAKDSDMFGESFANHIGNSLANGAKNNDLQGTDKRLKNRDKRIETPPIVPHGKFDEFWDAYPKPRNGGKAPAKVQWEKIIKSGTDPNRLTAAAKRYAASRVVADGYVKHVFRWLRDGRYNDEPELMNGKSNGHASASHDEAISAGIERYVQGLDEGPRASGRVGTPPLVEDHGET